MIKLDTVIYRSYLLCKMNIKLFVLLYEKDMKNTFLLFND